MPVLVGRTAAHLDNPRRIVTCLNVVSVTNSKRLTTKLQRRIRKNSKYLILNPESNLDCEQEVARKPGTPPLARQIRALSLARFALARSLCTVLHLPASLAPRAALAHHLHRPAPSMCLSSSAAPSRTLRRKIAIMIAIFAIMIAIMIARAIYGPILPIFAAILQDSHCYPCYLCYPRANDSRSIAISRIALSRIAI